MRECSNVGEGTICIKVAGQKQRRYFEAKGVVPLGAQEKIQVDRWVGAISQGCEYQAKESESQSIHKLVR